MTGRSDELHDWRFCVDEVSAGVYRARGTDKDGRFVEMTGTDSDALLSQCRCRAHEIVRLNRKTGGERR